jgi:murein DD-endopeptidase MepM/ murein hydrolase activator NlpD
MRNRRQEITREGIALLRPVNRAASAGWKGKPLIAALLPVAAVAAMISSNWQTRVDGGAGYPRELPAYPLPPVIIEPLESLGDAVQQQARALGSLLEESAEALMPSRLVKTLSIARGDTLMKVLTKASVGNTESAEAVRALGAVFNPRNLQLGQELTLTFEQGDDGMRLAALDFSDRVERTLSVMRTHDGFSAREIPRKFDKGMVRATGTITSSLYEAAISAGIPMPVLTKMIRLFSYDVDFQREVQPGDSFEVYFETFADEAGRAVKSGFIQSAAMILSGQELRYYRFAPRGEDTDYFTASGQSVRKALLRTPIDGARLTSGFGMRNHPVMGFSRMHRGVDFGAAAGTPIQAAGDGVVETAGWSGGYGNYVRLRHNGTYATAYGHMSRIAVKAGQRVRQGQIIGYVGSTGMSTGPHLHYETLINGSQINPLSIRLPAGGKLEGKDFATFRTAIAELDERRRTTPAANFLVSQER